MTALHCSLHAGNVADFLFTVHPQTRHYACICACNGVYLLCNTANRGWLALACWTKISYSIAWSENRLAIWYLITLVSLQKYWTRLRDSPRQKQAHPHSWGICYVWILIFFSLPVLPILPVWLPVWCRVARYWCPVKQAAQSTALALFLFVWW